MQPPLVLVATTMSWHYALRKKFQQRYRFKTLGTHLLGLQSGSLPAVSQLMQGVCKGAVSVAGVVHIICREGQGPDHLQHLPHDHIKLQQMRPNAAVQRGVQLPQGAPFYQSLRSPAQPVDKTDDPRGENVSFNRYLDYFQLLTKGSDEGWMQPRSQSR